jgi:hypothetical protein
VHRSPRWSVLLGSLLVGALVLRALWIGAPAARAGDEGDGAAPAAPASETPASRALSDEEAAPLVERLKRASRKRDAADVLPVLRDLEGLSHPGFQKPLLKLLGHAQPDVALAAADRLADQVVPDERDAAKLARAVWKAGWVDRANKDRLRVRARCLVAIAAVTKTPLDKGDFDDVEALWRRVTTEPDRVNAPVLVDVCRYVRLSGDKRLCRWLGEELDEPNATDVHSGTNPPASWWEERWYLWNGVVKDVVETLHVLTGETFKTSEQAKAWFEAHEQDFGFHW